MVWIMKRLSCDERSKRTGEAERGLERVGEIYDKRLVRKGKGERKRAM